MALNPTEEDDEDRSDEEEQDKGVVDVPDESPRLELLLSDAELDQLLSTLPRHEDLSGVVASAASDTKALRPRSEMQWVLAFLTDPNAIARVDSEAKQFFGSCGQHDDNYQNFLQDLGEANLLVPPPISAVDRHGQQQGEADCIDARIDNNKDGDDQEEWERTRRAMKHSKKLCELIE